MTTDKQKQVNTQPAPRRAGLAIILLFLLLCLSGIGYLLFTFERLHANINRASTRLNLLQLQQTKTDQALAHQLKLNQTQQNDLQQQLAAINNTIQSPLGEQANQTNDWVLHKAAYYLELARINARWSEDKATTQALLNSADTLLATRTEDQVIAIRQLLHLEQQQLMNISPLDKIGILSQLDAISQTIMSWPLNPFMINKPITKTTATPPLNWKEHLHHTVDQLSQLIIVTHHKTQRSAPTPQQRALLKETLQLLLQETQWAVISQNNAIYQLTLSQAVRILQQFPESQRAATTPVLEQLLTLKNTTIPSIARISIRSLTALKQLINGTPAEKTHHQKEASS